MIGKTFKIQGMSCAACARAAERAVKKLDGVIEANVNFATEKLTCTYDERKIALEDIKNAIKKAGYEAMDEENNKEIIIGIEGMT
jgi:Cu+-exporting ATPase